MLRSAATQDDDSADKDLDTIRKPTKEMPENTAQEQVATADTEIAETGKLKEPDAEKHAAEGIYEAGGISTEGPFRDTAALGDAATDDSSEHNLMSTNNPSDPDKEICLGNVAASAPPERTLRLRKRNQKKEGF